MRSRQQALGQHFLHDKSVIARIIAAAESAADAENADAIVEVGPGKLAITKDLVALAAKKKIPIIIVERDLRLERGIRILLGEQPPEIHFMDAATDEFLNLLDSLSERGFKRILFVSNLPYSAAAPIIANLCKRVSLLVGAVIMTQKEMADRIRANTGTKKRGALSLLVQSYFQCGAHFDVNPGAFTPPPQVMSTVLSLTPLKISPVKGIEDLLAFERFCKGLFSGRRKMIRNLLTDEAILGLEKLGLKGTERPEELSIEAAVALYKLGGL